MKTMMHSIVNAIASIISGNEICPVPKIIGMGPIRRISPKESFNPKNIVASIKIIIPANISKNPKKKIFMNGI